jgi:hypothetical protein
VFAVPGQSDTLSSDAHLQDTALLLGYFQVCRTPLRPLQGQPYRTARCCEHPLITGLQQEAKNYKHIFEAAHDAATDNLRLEQLSTSEQVSIQ